MNDQTTTPKPITDVTTSQPEATAPVLELLVQIPLRRGGHVALSLQSWPDGPPRAPSLRIEHMSATGHAMGIVMAPTFAREFTAAVLRWQAIVAGSGGGR
jgi:hypothetical protein